MKLLNIDQMSRQTNKIILIGGVQYSIEPMTVGAFIKKTKEAEEYLAAGVANPMKEIEMVVDLISQCVPSAPRYVIESLTLEQLEKIAKYIQKDDVDGAEDVEGNA